MKLVFILYMVLGFVSVGGLLSEKGLRGEDLWVAIVGSVLLGGLYLLGLSQTKGDRKFFRMDRKLWTIGVLLSYGVGAFGGYRLIS